MLGVIKTSELDKLLTTHPARLPSQNCCLWYLVFIVKDIAAPRSERGEECLEDERVCRMSWGRDGFRREKWSTHVSVCNERSQNDRTIVH